MNYTAKLDDRIKDKGDINLFLTNVNLTPEQKKKVVEFVSNAFSVGYNECHYNLTANFGDGK